MPFSKPTRREALAAFLAAPAAGLSSTPTEWNLYEAAQQIRRKKISPVELTRACLERVERLNARLNAFITVTAEQAMAQARALEAEIAGGKWRGPLHGIPVGLKDLYDTAGIKTTCASAIFADRVPAEDAEVVGRLKQAGAVLVGKQNMHEFAYGSTSVPSHYGAVHNPWNGGRIAGGSSGGSAAAVAAGMCFAAMGSDTGGSIRQPAAFCGITGLKPTYGRVSTRGMVPLSWSLDHAGPLCRSAVDAALVLEAIAGYDALDPASLDRAVDGYSLAARGKTAALRAGVVRKPFFEQLDPEIEAAVNAAIGVIAKLTAGVEEAELPAFARLPIAPAEAYTFHLPYYSRTPELYQPMTRQRIESGAGVSTTAYIEARRELDRLRRSVAGSFARFDVLITPTSPLNPVTIDEGAVPEVPPPGGVPRLLRNTQPFDVFGIPAISIPCGFTRDGMPIGLQIAGPPFGESKVLALAHACQQATDWHTRRPSL